jgi:hypothetical protein
MNVPIRPDPLGPARLPDETARAYRAFCVYRDLGPDRSLDRAWQRFCANQGKEHGPAMRRPGHWTAWSTRFQWVDRADAYDDLIDETRRIADAEFSRKHQQDRSRFKHQDEPRMEKLVLTIDDVFERLAKASQMEAIQVSFDKATGKKITTKIKALNGRDLAALVKVRSDIARQIIEGYAVEEALEEERLIERVVWKKNPDARRDQPGSRSGNRQPIAELVDPEAEEDKAA